MVSHPILPFTADRAFICVHLKCEKKYAFALKSSKIDKVEYSFISFLSFVGLVKKEDFPFITYYCPHCHALNRSNQSEEQVSGHGSPSAGSLRARTTSDPTNIATFMNDNSVLTSNIHAETISEIQDTIGKTGSGDLVSEEEKVCTAETT